MEKIVGMKRSQVVKNVMKKRGESASGKLKMAIKVVRKFRMVLAM